jgi:PAS domain S-box-containing protein
MQVKTTRIVLLYLLLSACWILFGDGIIVFLSSISDVGKEKLEILNGIFFILITAALLHFGIQKQQATLLASEKQFKDLFYSNPTPMWIYDLATLKFLDVNEAAVGVYGYTSEEFKSKTVLDIRSKEEQEKLMRLTKTMPNKQNFSGNWEHVKKNGEKLIAAVNYHRILFNNRECVMVTAQDVTKQQEKDQQLKVLYSTEKELKEELERNIVLIERSLEEKQRLAEVIDRIQNMVIITDPSGTIIWVNQAFINHTGYRYEEAVGRKSDFLHGPKTNPETQPEIMQALLENDFGVFEILNYTKTGQEYWVELTISAVYNEDKQVVRYISVQNIITERKLRDEKILQQNKILKTLAWTNSHALRKPVASIISLVDLSMDTSNMKELRQIHQLIGVCAKELDDITRDVGKVIDDTESV